MSQALEIYADLLNSDGEFAPQTVHFLNHNLTSFVYYNICIYGSAIFFGFLLHYLIQKLDWDKKTKLLRFKNIWYYVFSGEILKFKKFLKASIDVKIDAMTKDQNTIVTYADVLCEENGTTKLYTGYLVDYDLDSNDMHQLDKIYLLDAHRYEKCDSKQFKFQSNYSLRDIKGHLFVVDYQRVINLNLTYVPSYNQLTKIHQSKDKLTEWYMNAQVYLRLPLFLLIIDLVFFQYIFSISKINTFDYFAKATFLLTLLTLYTSVFKIIEYYLIKAKITRFAQRLELIKEKWNATPISKDSIKPLRIGVLIRRHLKFLNRKKRRVNRGRNAACLAFFVYALLTFVYTHLTS